MDEKKKEQNAIRQKRYRERQKATLDGVANNERKLSDALLSVTLALIDGLSTKTDKTPDMVNPLLELRRSGAFTDPALYEALLRLDTLHQTLQVTRKPSDRYEDGTLKLV